MFATFLVLFLAFCAAAESQVFNAKVIFYHSSTSVVYQLINAEKIFENSSFIKTRPTVMYFHGYTENSDKDSVKTVVSAYAKNDGFNILILDWRELATAFYMFSASNIDKLGIEVAKFIQKMTTLGYAINNWHLVGYSLGAHLAGSVGRHVQYLSNKLLILPRITGLDPAFPGFYILLVGSRSINKSDATFVDVIHTDAGILGCPFSTGTVDFWPNEGRRPQPGCSILDGCSHHRSIYFWAESVESKGKVAFTSQNEVYSQIQVQMGLNCLTNSQPGRYKLVTNSKPPYSRG